MTKKTILILITLLIATFAWLNWVILPSIGVMMFVRTLPFHLILLVFAGRVGYLIAEWILLEQVKRAEDGMRYWMYRSGEIMLISGQGSAVCKRMLVEAENLNRDTRQRERRISEERMALVEEIEEINDLRERDQKNTEREKRLDSREKEVSNMKGKIKRLEARIEELEAKIDELKETM